MITISASKCTVFDYKIVTLALNKTLFLCGSNTFNGQTITLLQMLF
ncbi:hypothetical protein ADICYQ_1879 [Cyclobacterium qasimii M12-11B]|uniref:Uncharacterized protein n=1 Tax=Cyclobacterium qasimii M12-11B TaxID=641524 RepID=S7VHU2_9BACT|nr:hypothetical protein ADICYQ_1879 [Cyclobacterium qasimii M12-11B]